MKLLSKAAARSVIPVETARQEAKGNVHASDGERTDALDGDLLN
jgi:hypothetical protein